MKINKTRFVPQSREDIKMSIPLAVEYDAQELPNNKAIIL
jgi:hypothetical protein